MLPSVRPASAGSAASASFLRLSSTPMPTTLPAGSEAARSFGSFLPNERLPTEYGVAYVTVRHAMQVLPRARPHRDYRHGRGAFRRSLAPLRYRPDGLASHPSHLAEGQVEHEGARRASRLRRTRPDAGIVRVRRLPSPAATPVPTSRLLSAATALAWMSKPTDGSSTLKKPFAAATWKPARAGRHSQVFHGVRHHPGPGCGFVHQFPVAADGTDVRIALRWRGSERLLNDQPSSGPEHSGDLAERPLRIGLVHEEGAGLFPEVERAASTGRVEDPGRCHQGRSAGACP